MSTLSFKTPLRVVKFLTVFFTVLVMALTVSPLSGRAFDVRDGEMAAPLFASDFSNQVPSPAMADSCLPLLKSIRHTTPPSAMDRNQRSAGKAAVLGLVFGFRFALTPPEKAQSCRAGKARLDVWQPARTTAGNRHALAVADYNRCQKEQALRALSGFRWQR